MYRTLRFHLKEHAMYAFWMFWALIIGSISTVSSDDWSKPITKGFTRLLLGFMFAGIGIPLMSSIAWPPVADDMWAPRLILGSYACIASYAIGLFVTQGARWLINKRFPPFVPTR